MNIELKKEMYYLWKEGYEIVEAVKSDKGKNLFFTHSVQDVFIGLLAVSRIWICAMLWTLSY